MSKLVTLSVPHSTDGALVNRLVAGCQPLDRNSVYCNLLQCDHFAATSVIAKTDDGDVVGFISGYRVPERNDSLFIWQVAVDESQRGTGLATRMIQSILSRPAMSGIRYIETTITESNKASWALFTRLADRLSASLEKSEYYGSLTHFQGEHDSEMLVRIGPVSQKKNRREK
ncbi:diaminobutyrate acetyltransferase [Reinekea marinisedimentorum]|uniref:L-2,4-diaminobutyric acid acetyltransferase n=1 Tax=Reinekea marinisedimentorum TaxID=230495 RepID=A0A4R3I6Q4_9GAMM|nr:diaminobutyrate acetyltransferase [Reinekea marinisedimentorum]TCS39759.1 L-2,4-diaminobutyric acid acetyltransferase [Reinekea marinisedimentorum]